MDSLISQIVWQYGEIPPQDRQDTEVHMNKATLSTLGRSTPWLGAETAPPTHVFGLPIRIDDNLPDGVAQMVTETQQERMLRRLARDGITVNMMQLPPMSPLIMPAPEPTLRALLAKWRKRIFKR